MENASKALIIAGAILIAILLISVGIIVMNNTNRPIDAAAAESVTQAAQIFNAKFEPYVGNNKSASDVKNIYNAITSNTDKNHQIALKLWPKTAGIPHLNLGGVATEPYSKILPYIDNNKTYNVNATYVNSSTKMSNNEINVYNSDHLEYGTIKSEQGYIYLISIYEN